MNVYFLIIFEKVFTENFSVLHHLLDLLADFREHFFGLLVFHESHEVLLVEVEFLFEVHDDVLELEFHIAPVVPVEVAVVAVPDWPSEFGVFGLVFFFAVFVVQDFHVDVGVHHVVLVDEVLDVDKNLRELLAMLFHEIDKLDESSLAVKSSATLVVGGSVPDFPAVFWLLFWFFWSLEIKVVLAVENFHVDVSVDHVVLVDEILDVDQKSWHIAIVLFKMLEECVEVHFADFMIWGAGTVLFFGALGALVVGRAGSSRLVVFVEVDVDVGDEVLLKVDVGFDI